MISGQIGPVRACRAGPVPKGFAEPSLRMALEWWIRPLASGCFPEPSTHESPRHQELLTHQAKEALRQTRREIVRCLKCPSFFWALCLPKKKSNLCILSGPSQKGTAPQGKWYSRELGEMSSRTKAPGPLHKPPALLSHGEERQNV